MAKSSPKEESVEHIEVITVEDLRDTAMRCLQESKKTGNYDLVVGVTPEWLFALANCLEEAGIEHIGDPDADEDQLEFVGFDESDDSEDALN